ncbi:MAG: aspartate aminotransferase family protein, partial [Planctomycetales bacterium]
MTASASAIINAYRKRTPRSEQLAAAARETFPSGITHDARRLDPYPIYVERAEGSRKWDVDGNEYVDYSGGHGALLLGHNHPEVMQAVQAQLAQGTHYGACHELEIEWGRWVQRLVPSAEKVRFTSSGTEATLLAFRLARAFTGKSKIVRFLGHFHGWHDHAAFGMYSHMDGSPSSGVLPGIADNVLLCPPGDVAAVASLLDGRDDVAGVILEPTGASWGQVPLDAEYLRSLRELTAARDVLLIFDEVISGFRVSPGGAQAHYEIMPDLTTLAKILAGGFPGGAIVGRGDVMDLLDFRSGREKISHHGTFNANPVSAAAGIAALRIVAETDACDQANQQAARLRDALNAVFHEESVDWIAYGSFSGFHLFTNPDHESLTAADVMAGKVPLEKLKDRRNASLFQKLRLGMLVHGVEIFGWPGGPVSSVHDDDALAHTADALRATLRL